LDGVRELLDAIDWSETGPLQSTSARQGQTNQIVDAALAKVRLGLTQDALIKLDQYVQNMKHHIVIYGAVPKQ
jgi:hypothetical protein